MSILSTGTKAADFTLNVTPDQKLSLSEFAGRRLILAFYPADWSPVCGDQMSLYNHILPEFRRHGAELVGISVDGPWCHQAFARDRNLHFALLSDFEPKGSVAKSFGAYRNAEGVAERALFVGELFSTTVLYGTLVVAATLVVGLAVGGTMIRKASI